MPGTVYRKPFVKGGHSSREYAKIPETGKASSHAYFCDPGQSAKRMGGLEGLKNVSSLQISAVCPSAAWTALSLVTTALPGCLSQTRLLVPSLEKISVTNRELLGFPLPFWLAEMDQNVQGNIFRRLDLTQFFLIIGNLQHSC